MIDYLNWKETPAYAIDIETDDLDATKIWVMCWRRIQTGEVGECTTYDQVRDFFSRTHGAIYIGHNILKFDAPVLSRLCGVACGVANCIDTLVLSTLYSPSKVGGHSLDTWGEELGLEKIKFSDWTGLSQEMITYCHRDVELTAKLFVRLMKTLDRIGFTNQSIWIQHHFMELLHRQHLNGFEFDGVRAIELYQMLRKKEEELDVAIKEGGLFPPVRVLVAKRQCFKKDGSETSIYKQDKERYIIKLIGDGQYLAYRDDEFNIGSSKQRIDKLIALGWEPEEFTEKTKKGGGGNPKPFDKGDLTPSLKRFVEEKDIPEARMIAEWMSVNGRANMINTWLENWNIDDQKIHGKLFVANTLRLRHQAPNTANIPAVRLLEVKENGKVVEKIPLMGDEGAWTYEARDLWVARKGRVLVGTDAAGLELRMLAHYLNRPGFTKQVVEGDPHQYNADVAGVTRPQAKTLIYAIMYGAAAPKIAKTLGVGVKEGARIRHQFLDRLGIGDLMDACKKEQEQGRIELVDGSQVICNSPHAALNYKLQGGGARVMALSAVLADREVRKKGWDVLKVGDIHDEDQSDCAVEIADEFGQMRVWSITQAGILLKLNVPLDGEYKVGRTWAETH